MFVNLARIVASLSAGLVLALTVAGCGYKGDLTQPPSPVANAPLTAPPATLPPASQN